MTYDVIVMVRGYSRRLWDMGEWKFALAAGIQFIAIHIIINCTHRHKSVKETAEPFTSVYVSFYKGLGAISGAMLLGDAEFISEARVWLQRMGGNLYSVLPYAVSAWDGFRMFCLKEEAQTNDKGNKGCNLIYDSKVFEERRKKLARILQLLNEDAAITSIVKFDPAIPETNMVRGYMRMHYDECMAALEAVEKNTGIRVLSRVRSSPSSQFGCYFELTMGESNASIDDDVFVFGWNQFAQEVTCK